MYRAYLKKHPEMKTIVARVKELFLAAKQSPSEMSKLIDTYLVPQQSEKKQNAEVSTPYSLRQEMLDSVPQEFWTSPKKIFEPCCGKGGFVLDVVNRFMTGLRTFEPNEKKRYKHIVEECIYFADINPVNIFVTKLLLDPKEEYALQYHEGDTLQLSVIEKWDLEGFDLVVGNPPYNDNSGNKGKGHTLWTRFVEKALDEWCIKDGYLLYVHPALWRQVDHPLLSILLQYHLVYIRIHNEKDGLQTFRCNTRYDWYLLQKTKQLDSITEIRDEEKKYHNVNLTNWLFIPNKWFDVVDALLAKTSQERGHIINERSTYGADKSHMSRTETKENKYPCIYSINRNNEPTFFWSTHNTKGHFGVSKVIYGSGATGFLSDADGRYGLTQWCSAIVCPPKEHKRLIDVLNSPTFHQFKLALSVSKAEINTKNLRLLKNNWWKDPFWS